MKVLLDTHLLLWAATNHSRLPGSVRVFLEDPGHTAMFSSASIWEVAIKFAKGRPDFLVSPIAFRRGLHNAGYLEVPIDGSAAELIASLPPIHSDPFDRILIAQAEVLGVPLWTADPLVASYGKGIHLFNT